MILAGIFHQFINEKSDIEKINQPEVITKFLKKLSNDLNASYLEDPEYNASTTNPVEIEKFVSGFKFEI